MWYRGQDKKYTPHILVVPWTNFSLPFPNKNFFIKNNNLDKVLIHFWKKKNWMGRKGEKKEKTHENKKVSSLLKVSKKFQLKYLNLKNMWDPISQFGIFVQVKDFCSYPLRYEQKYLTWINVPNWNMWSLVLIFSEHENKK